MRNADEDNLKAFHREVGCDEFMCLRIWSRQAFVNMVVSLWIPLKQRIS
jgi:hypothetical protein